MDEATLMGYINQYHRIKMKDGTTHFGMINDCNSGTVVVIGSRNSILQINLRDIERVL